jgi:hypothetical protein
MPTDPENQLLHFRLAVELLGGSRSAARAIDVSDRTMTRLIAGEADLHDGFMRDMAKALLRQAEACRELEKVLNPIFSSNVAEDQAHEDGRREGGRKRRKLEGEA